VFLRVLQKLQFDGDELIKAGTNIALFDHESND